MDWRPSSLRKVRSQRCSEGVWHTRIPPRRKLMASLSLSLSMTLEVNLELRLAQALRSQLEVLTPQPSPSSRTPQAHTPSPSRSQDSNSGPDEPLLNEEEEHWRLLEQEPITAQCLDSTDQSEFILKPLLLGKWFVSRWLLWAVEDLV